MCRTSARSPAPGSKPRRQEEHRPDRRINRRAMLRQSWGRRRSVSTPNRPPKRCPSHASGATIANPSVVLCSVKPTMRRAGAASQCKRGSTASPSPEIVGRSTARAPGPSRFVLGGDDAAAQPGADALEQQNTLGPRPEQHNLERLRQQFSGFRDPRAASTRRNASRPTVSAIEGHRRRRQALQKGNHSNPMSTGMTPMLPNRGEDAEEARIRRRRGHGNRDFMLECRAVDVSTLTTCASPSPMDTGCAALAG